MKRLFLSAVLVLFFCHPAKASLDDCNLICVYFPASCHDIHQEHSEFNACSNGTLSGSILGHGTCTVDRQDDRQQRWLHPFGVEMKCNPLTSGDRCTLDGTMTCSVRGSESTYALRCNGSANSPARAYADAMTAQCRHGDGSSEYCRCEAGTMRCGWCSRSDCAGVGLPLD